MSNIILGFSSDSLPISKLIKWFTRGRVNHAYVIYHDETLDEKIVMEASFSGYVLVPYKKWKKGRKEFAQFACQKDLSDSLKIMANKLGSGYDFLSALGLSLRRWFGKFFTNPFRNPTKMHCSEAMAVMLKDAGFKVGDPESKTPEDLLEFCIDNSAFHRIF